MDHVGQGRWYILNTLTQYENRVRDTIQRQINLDDPAVPVFEVQYPVEMIVEKRNGKTVPKPRKFFPGYVFVRMKLYKDGASDAAPDLDENVWHFITGIKGVSRIGGEMSPEEVAQWISIPGAETPVPMPSARPKFNVGDQVEIVDGPFQGSKGVIQEVDTEHGFLRVETMVFNRANSIELEPSQVEKFVE
jgi:transcriptional antiterminator NusG